MKRFLIIFFFIPFLSAAQPEGVQSVLIDENYTWPTASAERCDSFYFNLLPVCNAAYESYIRFSMSGCRVDLYSNDSRNYQGFITIYTTQLGYEKDKSSGMEYSKDVQYFYKNNVITPDTACMIAEALFSSGQDTIPTDSLLPAWHFMIFDCNAFAFEFKNENQCTDHRYFCPWGQSDSVKYIHTIRRNITFLLSVLKIDSLQRDLMNEVPSGKTYSSDGFILEYILTERQQKHYKRHSPQIEYLEAMEDTIYYYMEREIEKAKPNPKIKSDHITQYEYFHVAFNKKGRLKNVSFHRYPKLFTTFYFSDLYDIYCTKKTIRKIFRKADLRPLKLKYGFHLSCSFDSDLKLILMDTMWQL